MDDLLVVVPWGNPDEHREAALSWVARQWGALNLNIDGIRLGLGTTETGEWCKALGVENAIRDQPGDILVVTDADVFTDGVVEAINWVCNGAPWAIPHYKVHRLTPEATTDVLTGREPHDGMPLEPLIEATVPGFPYRGVDGGGIVVCRRDVYETCPLDPRFLGWGQEDESWALALRCLYGPAVRLSAPLWHLWHPPQPRLNRGQGSEAGMALYKRYARAKRRPEQMRALIDEGRSPCSPQPR